MLGFTPMIMFGKLLAEIASVCSGMSPATKHPLVKSTADRYDFRSLCSVQKLAATKLDE
jgi:hypothetical protein